MILALEPTGVTAAHELGWLPRAGDEDQAGACQELLQLPSAKLSKLRLLAVLFCNGTQKKPKVEFDSGLTDLTEPFSDEWQWLSRVCA
eukprot:6017935-Amphidinium_carterae.1